jgi:hypothetical protein
LYHYSVATEGDFVVVGSCNADAGRSYSPYSWSAPIQASSGAAYVFFRNATSDDGNDEWPMRWKLFPPEGRSGAAFGTSVSISGNFIVVGAPGTYGGIAYVYKYNGTEWNLHKKISAGWGDFGESVSISASAIVVGAPLVDAKDWAGGKAYLFTVDVALEKTFIAVDGALNHLFVTAV